MAPSDAGRSDGGRSDDGLSISCGPMTNSIQRELREIRGVLFEASSIESSFTLIWNKVQQLADHESGVVEDQRREIERLKGELEKLRQQDRGVADREATSAEGSTAEDSNGRGYAPFSESINMDSPGAGSSSRSLFSSESERPSSLSSPQNQRLTQKASFSQSSTAFEEKITSSDAELCGLVSPKDAGAEEILEMEESKSRIEGEIAELKRQVQLLLEERTRLIQEVEVHAHQSELVNELETSRESCARLQDEANALREAAVRAEERTARAIQEKLDILEEKERSFQEIRALRERANRAEVAEEAARRAEGHATEASERAAAETVARKEMQKEIERLREEKITAENELADWANGTITRKVAGGTSVAGGEAAAHEAGVQRLKDEIRALRGENALLRSTAKRNSEVICGLNNEVHSLLPVDEALADSAAPKVNATAIPVANNAETLVVSRKRSSASSQGSLGEDREHKRSICHEAHRDLLISIGSGSLEMIGGSCDPAQKERLGDSASGSGGRGRMDTLGSDAVSVLQQADNVSLLFGTESKNQKSNEDERSDHDQIRAHAQKLLYWAGKASERSKRSDTSGVSGTKEHEQQGGTINSKKHSSTPVPKMIGLPPRSQSRVRKSSTLPPRPPSTSTVSGSNSTMLSDRESGGSTTNGEVPGAYPAGPQASQGKKSVSLSEAGTIIHGLDNMDEGAPVTCCECSFSPFSDPQSEFYLPKLGLACACGAGSTIGDRESFSKNPTDLRNILRPWQCHFLSALGVTTADGLLRAHRADANGMARGMKGWRSSQGMAARRSRECCVALKIWSRTCKVVLRSVREQEGRGAAIERPRFLDITFADAHTIASVSTLGQLSSVGGGGRPFEMMEI